VAQRERWSQKPSTRQAEESVPESPDGDDENVRVEEPTGQVALFADGDAERFRSRWEAVQVSFVDEPRHAVEEADGLVEEMIERLSNGFSAQRKRLEQAWTSEDEVSTEDLRQSLQKYRSFFERLLSL
jgi:hypothetical protein